MTKTPVFITGNQNKADYLSKMLGMELEHQKVAVEEIQSATIEEVTEYKAKQAYAALGKPVLVEDSGLEFNALGKLPGPFIKFFVEVPNGLEIMCRMLDGFEDRSAQAVAVFGYYDGEKMTLIKGSVGGTIVDHPRGTNGWDWDKIFAPDGYSGLTQAEQTDENYEKVYGAIKPFMQLKAFLQQ